MTKIAFTGATCVAALMFAYAASAQAAVTYSSAQVNSNAYTQSSAGAGTANGYGTDADPSATFTPSLDASSSGTATSVLKAVPLASATAFEDASANFFNASSGTISFTGRTVAGASTAAGAASAQDDGEYYNYTFTVTTPSVFDLKYDFNETYAGVNNSFILLDNTDFTTVSQLQANGNLSGARSLDLAPGAYEFGASTEYGDFIAQSGIGAATGSHDEEYAFNIASAAPEPGVWALTLCGVGVLGAALRSSRVRRAEYRFAVA